jgi:DNA-binding MarR family transcriptional regulator
MAPVGYLLHEVARLMKRRFEVEAREHEMTLPQFRTLAQIAANPRATQTALSAAIDSDPMTMSGILDRLDKRGLIERYPNPDDSRAKLAHITPAGEEMVKSVRATGLELYSAAMAGISKADQKIIAEGLAQMRENLLTMTADLKEDA